MDKKKELLEKLAKIPQTISQKEAAEALQLSKSQISNLIKSKKIESYKEGKSPARPYLKAILEYETNPNKRRTTKK